MFLCLSEKIQLSCWGFLFVQIVKPELLSAVAENKIGYFSKVKPLHKGLTFATIPNMNRKTKLAPENYFHIYNRGVEKRKIFLAQEDYRRFLLLLYLCNSLTPVNVRELVRKGLTFAEVFSIERGETLADIGAYNLMPNHIHLLVKAKNEQGISRFMQKLFTGYTMYFNIKSKRTGGLFESTFKASLVETDEYLKYLFAYIHLNPIKIIEPEWKEKGIRNPKKAKEFLDNYRWSSYNYYREKKRQDRILNTKEFPKYFGKKNKKFKNFIEDWLSLNSANSAKV